MMCAVACQCVVQSVCKHNMVYDYGWLRAYVCGPFVNIASPGTVFTHCLTTRVPKTYRQTDRQTSNHHHSE